MHSCKDRVVKDKVLLEYLLIDLNFACSVCVPRTAVYIRDEAWVERPGTRPVPGYKFEPRFFRYCCSWAIYFPQTISNFVVKKTHQILNLFDIFSILILDQTFFKMRSGFCRMQSKLVYKRGTKTNELFWTLFRGAFYFKNTRVADESPGLRRALATPS
jgi:hypothetical protein